MGPEWRVGAVWGYTLLGEKTYSYYTAWTPGQWNSVCITANTNINLFRVVINGGVVYENTEYQGEFHNDQNIVLMNDGGQRQFQH